MEREERWPENIKRSRRQETQMPSCGEWPRPRSKGHRTAGMSVSLKPMFFPHTTHPFAASLQLGVRPSRVQTDNSRAPPYLQGPP